MHSRSAGNHRPLQWRLLLGVCLLAGCTSWRVQHVSPADLLSREPRRLRITRADRSRIELHRPQLVGDTIIDGRVRRGVRTKVPLNEVVDVAVRKWDPAETAALVVGTTAVGAVVTIGLIWDSRAD